MRLSRRNNCPCDSPPLDRILEIPFQRIRPPTGELRHNPFAIPLAQLISEAIRMGISPEFDTPIRPHDAAHRPKGAQQSVVFRCYLMRPSMLDQLGCRVISDWKSTLIPFPIL